MLNMQKKNVIDLELRISIYCLKKIKVHKKSLYLLLEPKQNVLLNFVFKYFITIVVTFANPKQYTKIFFTVNLNFKNSKIYPNCINSNLS
jgi:hypothetical protein